MTRRAPNHPKYYHSHPSDTPTTPQSPKSPYMAYGVDILDENFPFVVTFLIDGIYINILRPGRRGRGAGGNFRQLPLFAQCVSSVNKTILFPSNSALLYYQLKLKLERSERRMTNLKGRTASGRPISRSAHLYDPFVSPSDPPPTKALLAPVAARQHQQQRSKSRLLQPKRKGFFSTEPILIKKPRFAFSR